MEQILKGENKPLIITIVLYILVALYISFMNLRTMSMGFLGIILAISVMALFPMLIGFFSKDFKLSAIYSVMCATIVFVLDGSFTFDLDFLIGYAVLILFSALGVFIANKFVK